MAMEGPFGFTASGHDAGDAGGISWTNPENLTADDTSYAAVTLATTETAKRIKLTARGGAAIPAGSTVTGFVGIIRGYASAKNAIYPNNGVNTTMYLVIGGTTQTSRYPAGLAAALGQAEQNHGWPAGNGDLWNGSAPTVAQVNAAGFGMAFAVQNQHGSSQDATVDYASMELYYTPPAAAGWISMMLMRVGQLLSPLAAWAGLPRWAAWLAGTRRKTIALHPGRIEPCTAC